MEGTRICTLRWERRATEPATTDQQRYFPFRDEHGTESLLFIRGEAFFVTGYHQLRIDAHHPPIPLL